VCDLKRIINMSDPTTGAPYFCTKEFSVRKKGWGGRMKEAQRCADSG